MSIRDVSPLYSEYDDELVKTLEEVNTPELALTVRQNLLKRAKYTLAQMETDAYFHPSVHSEVVERHKQFQEAIVEAEHSLNKSVLSYANASSIKMKNSLSLQSTYTRDIDGSLLGLQAYLAKYKLLLTAGQNLLNHKQWTLRGIYMTVLSFNVILICAKIWRLFVWILSWFI